MKTIVCDRPGALVLRQRPVPQRGADEVLLRVRRVGVCGTDLHIYAGRQPYLSYPRVMGHEFSGEVIEAPEGSALRAGDAVYVRPYLSCGSCLACRRDKPNCCTALKVLGVHVDGALAEQVAVPQAFVHRADGIGLDEAAMIEFLAIGAHAVRRARLEPGRHALVVGAGPIGLAAAIFARLDGAEVTVLDLREDRLAFCREQLGLHTVRLGDEDLAALSARTGGEFFETVFDATGNPGAMERGFELVAHGGSYVLISVVASDIRFSDPEFHKREMTLLASRNAAPQDFERVLREMRAGRVPTALLATHRLAFDELPERFAELADPAAGAIKALVEL
ncbi:zinc-binding alcohol dehydrogenase family protein [Caldimonas tepidiphila]|uniref:zinc-binding alcohol dehydrogenase family protein n=1 Tax=Caldimonas tepidiphila TaxID=2315841 RepID=UPI000E5B3FF1|nr:zinc-binding alcohol dehydrogenase family protein [Caldimonas tepidiphila]